MFRRASLPRGLVLAAGWVLALASQAFAQERVWTDTTGRTLRGEFVREIDGDVTFLIGGKLVSVPLSRLSDRDRQIVRDLAAGKVVPLESDASQPAEDSPRREPAPSENAPPLIKRPKSIASRAWTEISGRKSTGKFVRIFEGDVVIARAGGPLKIDFFELSDEDQAYVRELMESRGEASMIPDKPIERPAEGGGGEAARERMPGRSGPGFGPAGFAPPDFGPRGFGPRGFEPGGGPPAFDSGPTAPMPGFRPSPVAGTSGESAFDAQQRMHDAQSAAASSSFDRLNQMQDDALQRGMASTLPPSSYLPPSTDSTFQQVPICSACGKQVSDTAATGQRCPHCGAYWAFNSYTGGKSGGGAVGGRPVTKLFADTDNERYVRTAIVVVSALVAVVVLIAGAIGVAVAIASASRSSRQYRQY